MHDALVRPGEFFKVVRRLCGLFADDGTDSRINYGMAAGPETPELGGDGSRGGSARQSFDTASSGQFRNVSSKLIGVEGDATTNSTKAMGDGGAGRDDKPNAAISAAGLKIPEQKQKVPPKDSLKHEADWDLDISSMPRFAGRR